MSQCKGHFNSAQSGAQKPNWYVEELKFCLSSNVSKAGSSGFIPSSMLSEFFGITVIEPTLRSVVVCDVDDFEGVAAS